ncbi:MAG: hypothetical protein ACM3SY_11925 [Candidatus Omnitrophota bacterium]
MKLLNVELFRRKQVTVCLLLVLSCCFFSHALMGVESKSNGDINVYEKKQLFIFPMVCNNHISSERKDFLENQLYKMFVIDFKRIDYCSIKAEDTIDSFLQDAHAYILKNIKSITTKRLQPDGKFKEEMVTAEDLLKTTENAFVLVPVIDSLKKEAVCKKNSTDYIYTMYVHFDIYSTKTKEKLKTLQINNKTNLLGSLASISGGFEVDNSDLAGLPEETQKDEETFRSSSTGLFVVLKKQLKEMPEFRITAALSKVNHTSFGFDMGKDSSIKIDHRYKTYVTTADGKQKMTGFGKIRTVADSSSEAQILIGHPTEGDQVMEEPKVGINVTAGLGVMPCNIALSDSYNDYAVTGSHMCLLLGLEYELGPVIGASELYAGLNLRLGSPAFAPTSFIIYGDKYVAQVIVNAGVIKKFYFRRFALQLGGFLGVHAASIAELHSDYDKITGGSIGFTLNSQLEIMIAPSVSAYGGINLDVYPNPAELDVDGDTYDFPKGASWKAVGLGLNFGLKVTL